jgi:hypothetical protein
MRMLRRSLRLLMHKVDAVGLPCGPANTTKMNNQDIVIDENQRGMNPFVQDGRVMIGPMMHVNHQELVDMLRAQNEENIRVIARAALVRAQAEALIAQLQPQPQPLWRRIFRQGRFNLRRRRNNRNN